MPITLSRGYPDPSKERVEERSYGDKTIVFRVVGDDQIVWIEVVSPNGDKVEIDPNYVDIAAYRELLAAAR